MAGEEETRLGEVARDAAVARKRREKEVLGAVREAGRVVAQLAEKIEEEAGRIRGAAVWIENKYYEPRLKPRVHRTSRLPSIPPLPDPTPRGTVLALPFCSCRGRAGDHASGMRQVRAQGGRCARGVGEDAQGTAVGEAVKAEEDGGRADGDAGRYGRGVEGTRVVKVEKMPCEEPVGCGERGVGEGAEAGERIPSSKRLREPVERASGEGKKQRDVEGKGNGVVVRENGGEEGLRGAMEEVERAMEEVRGCVEERVAEILKVVPRVADRLDGRALHDEPGWTWREAMVHALSQPGMAEVRWCCDARQVGTCHVLHIACTSCA
ncbi:unnamed protein product [Closterium sp. NIES-65]|nr:unnamed protein product [Closterium sp. NIES-65]